MNDEATGITEEEVRRIQRSYTDWYKAWYANLNLPEAPSTKDLLERYGGDLINWRNVYENSDYIIYEEPSS